MSYAVFQDAIDQNMWTLLMAEYMTTLTKARAHAHAPLPRCTDSSSSSQETSTGLYVDLACEETRLQSSQQVELNCKQNGLRKTFLTFGLCLTPLVTLTAFSSTTSLSAAISLQ